MNDLDLRAQASLTEEIAHGSRRFRFRHMPADWRSVRCTKLALRLIDKRAGALEEVHESALVHEGSVPGTLSTVVRKFDDV